MDICVNACEYICVCDCVLNWKKKITIIKTADMTIELTISTPLMVSSALTYVFTNMSPMSKQGSCLNAVYFILLIPINISDTLQ